MLLFLWLARLREQWFGKLGEQRRKRYRPVVRRLRLETLEDRIVPSGGTPSVTGTWTQISMPPGGAGTMFLLPNGDVMAEGGGVTNSWYQFTPSATGGYANGTWSPLASMSRPRLYFGSAVLPNDKVFVVGGEYSINGGRGTWDNTGEIYSMASNSWSSIPNFPQGSFGDDPTDLLPDGKVLCGYLSGPQTYLYDPSTNSWSNGPTKLNGDGSDEETWIKLPVSAALPDGGILSYDIGTSIGSGTIRGQVLNIATMTWQETQDSGSNPLPLLSTGALGEELGGGFVLPNGSVFLIGATGNTALYNPATNRWSAGPQIIDNSGNLCGADDAPASILPDGQVVFAADYGPTSGTWSPPTELFDYDYTSNTITQITNVPGTLSGDLGFSSAYIDRTLVLPTGQMMFDDAYNMFLFTPSDSAQSAWQPTITGVTNLGGGLYTLAGTQLSGISEGSSYGDDVNVSENYPIVQITAGNGNVYYATSSNWSNVMVSAVGDTTPESVDFTLPANLANVVASKGVYQLSVSANGISSASQTFYIGNPVTVAAQSASATFSTNSQTLKLKADVNPVVGSTPVNEGTVTFTVKDQNGKTVGSPVTGSVSNGVASAKFTLPANEPVNGTYTIYVSYSDSTGPDFDDGDSSAGLTISPAQVSTTAAALSTSYSLSAQTFTLSASLTDNSFLSDTVNEGSVNFTVSNGATILFQGPVAVNSDAASVSFTVPPKEPPGVFSITVSYFDKLGNFVDGGDNDSSLTISPAQVSVAPVNAPAIYSLKDQNLTLSAGVADDSFPNQTVNEGTVLFTVMDGFTKVGSASGTINTGEAIATFKLPGATPAGTYTIDVGYSDALGNFADNGSGDTTASLVVGSANVTTTAAAPPTVVYNANAQSIAVSAAVADVSFSADKVNEGNVTFNLMKGGTTLSSIQAAVSNGAANATLSVPAGLPPGSYTLAVSYSDGATPPINFVDNGDFNATLTVNRAGVTTTAANASLNYSPNPQIVTLNAGLSSGSGASINEGVVTFTIKQGSTIVGNVYGNVYGTAGGGQASATFPWPAIRTQGAYTFGAGIYTVAVSYYDSQGNFSDTGDNSGTLTVNPAQVSTTAATPSSVLFSSNTQSVTLSANVSDLTIPSDTVNEGAVTFTLQDKNGKTVGTPITSAVTNGTANAVYALPAGLDAGSYTVAVGYGDKPSNMIDGGDKSAQLIVAPVHVTTTANSLSAFYSPNSQTVNLSAHVANDDVPNNAVNEGVVQFTILSGGATIGTAQGNVSNGNASAAFTLPAGSSLGSYTIQVGYSDANNNFIDSGDNNATLTVSHAAVTTTANNVVTPYSPNGQTIALSASVADGSISTDKVGEGSVTFTIVQGGNTIGTAQAAVSGGKASTNFALNPGQAVGGYTIEVGYSDSAANFVDTGNTNAALTIASAQVTTTANPVSAIFSTNSQKLALSAGVVDDSIGTDKVNEGLVTFTILNGSTPLGSVQAAVSNGAANADFTLAPGQVVNNYTIAVSYSDSSAHFTDGGDNDAQLSVSPAQVSTTANVSSAVYSTNNEIVKLSANVSDDSIPTDKVNEGIVTFTLSNGAKTLGTVQGTVAGGTATGVLTLPAGVTPGDYTISVSYSDGNGNFQSSGSGGGGTSSALTVGAANVVASAIPNAAAVYSQSTQTVTLRANVVDSDVASDIVNQGVVNFTVMNGSTPLGSVQGAVNNGAASAAFTLPAGLAAGNYTIAVSYFDRLDYFRDSGESFATLTVAPADATASAAAVTTTYSSAPQTVMLSAVVADPGPASNVVGEGFASFALLSGSSTVATAVGAVNGGTANAAMALPAGLAAGNYTIAVSYDDGRGNFTDNGDNNSILSVNAAATTVQLSQVSLTPNYLSLTTTETLTAHVSSSSAVTQGTVTFYLSNIAVTAQVDGNGNAVAVVTVPMLGLLSPQTINLGYSDAAGDRTASSISQSANWGIINALVPSTATFDANGETVTADMFGLFITYTNGLLTEIDFGSTDLLLSYNAFGQLTQVKYNGMDLLP